MKTGTNPQPATTYPEHGTGRTAKLEICPHCGGKPMIIRKCVRRRICAVCERCGFHQRIKKGKP